MYRVLVVAALLCVSCGFVSSEKPGKVQHTLLPAAADDIVATSIAELPFGDKEAWTLVSQTDFDTALAQLPAAQRTTPLDGHFPLEDVTAIVNDAWTPGVYAKLRPETVEGAVEGRYWIIAGNDVGVDATGEYVITKNFTLAVIDLNIPKPEWVGFIGRAAKRPMAGSETGRCCGEEHLCVGSGTPTVGPCGDPSGKCARPDGTASFYVDQSSTNPFFSNLPKPPVTTLTYAQGELLPQTTCLPKLLGGCSASLGICGVGFDVDPNRHFDVSVVVPTCTGVNIERQVSGRAVPEQCTYANAQGESYVGGARASAAAMPAADCEGRCFECESTNFGVTGGGLPRACLLLRPVAGGGVCEANDTTRAMDQVNAQARFATMGSNPNQPGGSSTRCDPPNNQGLRRCLTCENNVCRDSFAVDWLTPSQGSNTNLICPGGQCPPAVVQTGTVAPSAPGSVVIGSPAPGQLSAARSPIADEAPVAQVLDSVSAPPPAVPSTNGPKANPNGSGTREDVPTDTNNATPAKTTEQSPHAAEDPIALMSGSLEVNHTDLAYAGPVRSLEFTRSYSSQGNERSELGSNWSHNWDVRLIPLRHENLPAGVDPYCEGTPADVTCLTLRTGTSSKLYMKDARDGLFKPQAGSFATVIATSDGWVLRGHDGHVQRFDADGYLTFDADRFGNGFVLEYELNAWGRLDKALCANAVLNLSASDGRWVVPNGPTGYSASSTTCVLLAGLVGRTKPMVKNSTTLGASDVVLPPNAPIELQQAKNLLLASQASGIGNASLWGQRIKRVKRVAELNDTPSLARALDFTYWPDTETTLVNGSSTLRLAGLLQRVSGPSGGSVSFSYRAAAVPERLAEALLASATRTDVAGQLGASLVAGPTRTYAFTYPQTTLTPSQLTDLTNRFSRYYDSVYNCSYVRFDPCGNPLVPAFNAFPAEELNRRIDAYVSDLADNLTRIDAPNEIVETQYETDPLSYSFDKVTAQRWGSSSAPPSPAQAPWATTLPQANLAYAEEGPDGTDGFLEAEVRARYGYEAVPWATEQNALSAGLLMAPNTTTSPQGPAGMLTGGTPVGNAVQCKPGEEKQLRTQLPGYRKSYDYYPLDLPMPPASGSMTDGLYTPGVDLDMTLKRSKLSCAQLAEAQTWDAQHNDLQTIFTAYNPTTKTFTKKSFGGRRAEMNSNANRICAWTRHTDRVGGLHVYGYNYHGRPLVSAIRVGSTWRFAETLYNADGNVIAQRKTLPQGTPWTSTSGDTRYGYVEGRIVGTNFQDPAPWYWSQRANVITILDRPRGGSVTDEVQETWVTESTIARYTELSYEPLFSQVSKIVSGDVPSSTSPRRVHQTTEILFDYQECASSACVTPLLQDAQRFGAQYPTDAAGNVLTATNPLSVPLGYGDLNGDGLVGFPYRGTVTRITTTGIGLSETRLFRFSPHGKPHFIQSAEGNVTALDYLPFGQLTGVGHGNERGYLSRVRVMRNRSTSTANGPNATPCPALPGPYRWLLPSTCSANSLQADLKTVAGLSDGVAAEIVRQATASDVASTTSFAYSVIGVPSVVYHADGAEVRTTRDVDGRAREVKLYETSTQLHSRTVYTLNSQGLPTRIERFNRTGGTLGATIQTWDEQGNLRFRCSEAVTGGCDGIAHGALPSASPVGGVSETFWYDRDDRLIREMDSGGAYTDYLLDERGWVTGVSTTAAGETGRHTAYTRNDDGQWLTRAQHAIVTASPLTLSAALTNESRTVDGYGRVSSVTDTEGRQSTVRFSAKDVVTSVTTAVSAWQVRYVRDGLSRVTERWVNGQKTLAVSRLPGGLVWQRQRLGSSPEFVTYDERGAAVFVRQGALTTVSVAPADRRWRGGGTIRSESRLATNSTEQTLDALGEVLSEVETGFDGTSAPPTRTSSFLRNDDGYLLQTTDSLGATSEFVPNLLGWRETERVTVNPGVVKSTTYTFNRRGQLVSRTDPRGGTNPGTAQTYTGFGEPKTRLVPGGTTSASDVLSTWTYDAAGRLTRETMGAAAVRYQYANDRVWRVTADDGTTVLKEYGYDPLGRVSSAKHANEGLSAWVTAAERMVLSTRDYDSLGRVKTETTKVGTRTTRTTSSTWTLGGAGWKRALTRPDGLTASEQYDGLGRLTTLNRAFGLKKSTFNYTGELEEGESHGTTGVGVTRTLEWDGFSQLRRSAYSQSTQFANVVFQRDREGRVVSINRDMKGKTFRGYKYQLGGAMEQVLEGSGNATPAGNGTDMTWASVLSTGTALGAQRYEYVRDVEGSALTVTRVDIGGQAPRYAAPGRVRGFQLTSYSLDGTASQSVTHDVAGRVTGEFGRTYEWDAMHALVRAGATSGTDAQAFQYDGFGKLVAVRRGTAGWPIEEELAYDGAQMVAAWNASQTVVWSAQWGQGVDNLVSVRMGATATEAFAVKDGLGNVIGTYRAEGSSVGLWAGAEYTPEGRITQKDWVANTACSETGLTKCPRMSGTPFGFHSAYKSPAHGLLYFRNRWYSTEAGQWLSMDPLGEVDSANLYSFNRFDSLNFIDPFGLSKKGAAKPQEALVTGKRMTEEERAARRMQEAQQRASENRDPGKPAGTAPAAVIPSAPLEPGSNIPQGPRPPGPSSTARMIRWPPDPLRPPTQPPSPIDVPDGPRLPRGGPVLVAVVFTYLVYEGITQGEEQLRRLERAHGPFSMAPSGGTPKAAPTPPPKVPEHPSSEPGVPERPSEPISDDGPEVDWDSFPKYGETPKGRPHTEHSRKQQSNRPGFTDDVIDAIIDGDPSPKERIDEEGRLTREHVDRRGNKVVVNEYGDIVTVHGPSEDDNGRYKQ